MLLHIPQNGMEEEKKTAPQAKKMSKIEFLQDHLIMWGKPNMVSFSIPFPIPIIPNQTQNLMVSILDKSRLICQMGRISIYKWGNG